MKYIEGQYLFLGPTCKSGRSWAATRPPVATPAAPAPPTFATRPSSGTPATPGQRGPPPPPPPSAWPQFCPSPSSSKMCCLGASSPPPLSNKWFMTIDFSSLVRGLYCLDYYVRTTERDSNGCIHTELRLSQIVNYFDASDIFSKLW